MTPWHWHFRSPEDLRSTLEEYAEYFLAKGAPPAGGDVVDETKADRQYRILAQNKAIDTFMWVLKRDDHKSWDILHGYYRMGLWSEFRGWYKVATAMLKWQLPACSQSVRCRVAGDDRRGIQTCPSVVCVGKRREFEERLDEAVLALFHAYQGRSQRTALDAPSVPVLTSN